MIQFFMIVLLMFGGALFFIYYKSKQEYGDGFRLFRRAQMIDLKTMRGGFSVLNIFLLAIFSFISYIHFNDINFPVPFILFFAFFFAFLNLANAGLRMHKMQVLKTLNNGIITEAKITERDVMQKRDDLIPYYKYLCEFQVINKNGAEKVIEAYLPEKVDDNLKVGDIIEVIYSKKKPKICFERIEKEEIKKIISIKNEFYDIIFSSLLLFIAIKLNKEFIFLDSATHALEFHFEYFEKFQFDKLIPTLIRSFRDNIVLDLSKFYFKELVTTLFLLIGSSFMFIKAIYRFIITFILLYIFLPKTKLY